MVSAKTIIVNKSPTVQMNVDLSDPEATFKVITTDQVPKQGEVLVKPLLFSNDPSQRAWIQKGIPAAAMYVEPIKEGEVMGAVAIAEVVESTIPEYSAGDIVTCSCGWSEYACLPKPKLFSKLPLSGLPLSAFLDFAGMTGITALYGLTEVHAVKASDVVVISGAAGATGSVAVQIAKNVIGCKKVIGIAGGADKCEYVKSLGADACVDYKEGDFFTAMSEALGEDKECDVYFDGVGGTILEKMMLLTKRHGTILACGSISGYNSGGSGVRSWGLITTRRLNVKGFIVLDYLHKAPEAVGKLVSYFQQGKIQFSKGSISMIDCVGQIEKLPGVLNMMFNGEKLTGKLIAKVADASNPAAKL